jgi:hypothetical protein
MITDESAAETKEKQSAPASALTGNEAASAAPTTNDRAPVEFAVVGKPRDNVAITRFATRENLADAETCEILLEVQNFSAAARQGNVELRLDGALLDVKPFALAPGEAKTELFAALPRPGADARGWFTARLDTDDALAVDNTAFAVIPRKEPARVLLVSQGNWFLEKLLASDHQVEFEIVAPDGFQLPMATQFDAVICDDFVPRDFDLATVAGNFFFVRRAPFASEAQTKEQPLITDLDTQHPVLRLVNLQNVTIVRANNLPMPPEENGWKWTAPLRAFEQPLLLAGARRVEGKEQRMIVLGFAIAESDLPLRIAFPLLMSNAVTWLAQRNPVRHDSLKAGEPLVLGAGEEVATPPRTAASALGPTPDARTSALFVPVKNGFYARHTAHGDERWLAVNTFDRAESDLRRPMQGETPRTDTARFSSLHRLPHWGGWPPWQYLALSALLLFAFEWWLFHRRRTE